MSVNVRHAGAAAHLVSQSQVEAIQLDEGRCLDGGLPPELLPPALQTQEAKPGHHVTQRAAGANGDACEVAGEVDGTTCPLGDNRWHIGRRGL